MTDAVLSLDAISVRYGERIAVDRMDFELNREITVLVGANGAGKSTLMRVLATAEPPTSGTLTFDGSAIDFSSARRLKAVRARIGWLPQVFGYEPRSSVVDFLSYLAWMKGICASSRRSKVNEVLEVVGLTDRANHQLRTLSGGMIRRVGVGQALLSGPELLILDEPTAGLDPVQRADLHDLIRTISADAVVLWSTHLAEDIEAVADHVIVIDAGRLIWQGTARELQRTCPHSSLNTAVAELIKGTPDAA